jgi:hypothetical protein
MKTTTKIPPIFSGRLIKKDSGEEIRVQIHVLSRNNRISIYPTIPSHLPGYYEVFDTIDDIEKDWQFINDGKDRSIFNPRSALEILNEYFGD